MITLLIWLKKVGIGKVCTLSDHRPIFLHISLSKVQKGRGFWRLNNDLLTDPKFIFGCNQVIRKTILSNSELYKTCNITNYLPNLEIPQATPEIPYTLLHDLILMNVRMYAMKFQAQLRREALEKSEKVNEEIERLVNYDDPEDIVKVNLLKNKAQDIEDEGDAAAARKYFAKMQIGGGNPYQVLL